MEDAGEGVRCSGGFGGNETGRDDGGDGRWGRWWRRRWGQAADASEVCLYKAVIE